MLLLLRETTDRSQERENGSTNPYGALSFCNEIRNGKRGKVGFAVQHPIRRVPLFNLLPFFCVVYIYFRLLDARQGV
jgi:hypothetical protein